MTSKSTWLIEYLEGLENFGCDQADGCTCGGKMWCLGCQQFQYPSADDAWMCRADRPVWMIS